MSDVFISYARKTAPHAKAAAGALEARGFSVWFDQHLPAHLSFSDVIEEELARAKVVLVIWSSEAIGSEWVRSEASRGRRQKKLVQLRVERTPLPMPFDQIHCADMIGWDGRGEPDNWPSVVSSIAKLVGAPSAAAATPSGAQGERRRLTLLSCGLVGAEGLARSLDPEDWHDLFRRYQLAVSGVLDGLGGLIVQTGDDLIAAFGYPVAQEDAGERALRAGLLITEAVAALSAEAGAPQGLSVQVGVHAGTVVVAPGPNGTTAVFGDAVNTVTRVRAAAAIGGVAATEPVQRRVAPLFVTEARDDVALSGPDTALRVHAVLSTRQTGEWALGVPAPAHTRFVGREEERRLLEGRWARARGGDGQLVLLTGEPGIGKTRLTQRFRDGLRDEEHQWIDCGGGQLFADTSFRAVRQMLEQGLGFGGAESPAERFERLEQALRAAGPQAAEAAPLVAEILNLPTPGRGQEAELNPDQRRRKLLAALTAWVLSVAADRPLVLAIEDLHWVDPSTLELVQALAEQGSRSRLLLLLTARPEFHVTWAARAHHLQIALSRLSSRETRELVAGLAARTAVPADLLDAVASRSDGVPLFAEELTMLLADGRDGPRADEIPETLLDSLAARLDRLGPAREIAHVASVIGREFSYGLVAAVAGMDETRLQAGLRRLADAELIHVQGYPPDAVYQFKHALILDAAYAALLKSRRRDLHGQVARAFLEKAPDVVERHPEVMARHWTEAGEVQLAVAGWAQAGLRAGSRAAHVEAEAHLQEALAVLRTLPVSPERTQSELTLLITLAVSTCAVHGFTAPRLAKSLLEAREICDALGNVAALFNVLIAICNFQITAGDLDAAEQTCRRCDKISRETGDPAQLILTGTAEGYILHTRGDLAASRRRLEEVADLYARHEGETLAYGVPQDPLVTTLVVLAVVLALQGDYADSMAVCERYVRHARALGRPFDIAWALQWRAAQLVAFGDYAGALDSAEEGYQLSDANAYSHFASTSLVLKGLALGGLGRMEEGMALFWPAFAERKRAGAVGPLGMFLGEAAILLLRSGDTAGALSAIDEAVALAEQGGQASLPKLLLCRAEILAAQAGPDSAAVAEQVRRALDIATVQGATPDVIRAKALLAAS